MLGAHTGENRVLIPELRREPKAAAGCVRLSLTGKAFATTWQVVAYVAEPLAAQSEVLRAQISALLERIDAEMSPYRADSDLTRFNQAPAGAYVPLPLMLLQVIRQGLNIAHLTDGAYDPTLLEAVELWGFGARAVPEGVPLGADISVLKNRQDWRRIDWKAQGLIKPEGVRLDLCGIAKGYAVDVVTQFLKTTAGIEAALIEIGGELKGFGVRDDGLPFWVDIEQAKEKTVVALCDLAVATSGESVRAFVHDGVIFSHTIDGQTASPSASGVMSVSVFDGACWRADALATALLVMGAEKAMAFATAQDVPCLMRMRNGSEQLSPALENWL
ncbi:MAG: FAD:protein FMN transferase [Asticcacaulis sp.]